MSVSGSGFFFTFTVGLVGLRIEFAILPFLAGLLSWHKLPFMNRITASLKLLVIFSCHGCVRQSGQCGNIGHLGPRSYSEGAIILRLLQGCATHVTKMNKIKHLHVKK